MHQVTCQTAATPPRHSVNAPWDFAPYSMGRAQWEQRAATLRQQVLVALGLWPMPPRPPIKAKVHRSIHRQGYVIQSVSFQSLPGHEVTGSLYRPVGVEGPLPTVLFPHGHWTNGRLMWNSDEKVQQELASGAETLPEAARSPLQANCVMLARMGCLVFHYDMVGYGDSQSLQHATGFMDAEALSRLQSFMGLQIWNGLRATDWLVSRDDVDVHRIAVCGSSGGGTQAIALGAIDERLAASFPMVMVSMNMQGGCVCENAPLYRLGTNNVELASLFAPRPLGTASANDWTHDFMARGLPEMKHVWGLIGQEGEVTANHVNFGHNHNLHSRLLQYDFLNRVLRLGWKGKLEEQSFEPVRPQVLSIVSDPRPERAEPPGANEMRRWMTQTSDDALTSMDDETYRHMVRVALKAAVMMGQLGGWYGSGQASDHPHNEIIQGEVASFTFHPPENPTGDALVYVSGDRLDLTVKAKLLERGWALAVIGLPHAQDESSGDRPAYAGMVLGYNRAVVAQQACDVLSCIAQVRSFAGVQRVHLLGDAGAGVAVLLARALAEGDVMRTAIDLEQFSFSAIDDPYDPMLLPGAPKYDGVSGMAALCEQGQTLLCGATEPRGKRIPPTVLWKSSCAPTLELARWLVCEGP